jgi:hypothetical protein
MFTRSFDCDRTCPLYEKIDTCRFNALFRQIGNAPEVYSETTKIKVEYKNLQALEQAVIKMGGALLQGTSHKLYETTETGVGITLPGWRHPLVLREDGTLAYDHYHGEWGEPKDLEKLEGHYAVEAARLAASQLGWMSQDQPDGTLLVFHPDGGTLVASAAGVNANGFQGVGCHDAATLLSSAMGSVVGQELKQEYFQAEQQIGEEE